MKIDGRCHCGFITYEAEVDPDEVYVCHCTDCQAISGTAFRWAVPVPEAAFKLVLSILQVALGVQLILWALAMLGIVEGIRF